MAYVLSSVSGNLISAASAGYAPTNSGDVSAIASAYQVVSATATQLYAGTSYLTSVNDAPISAARAGNAANASLANSAWYDGTGRLISALPDSAAVSAIASSYAESAVSSKLDSSAASGFYTTANESGFVDSSYVDSAVSSKQDKLTFGYDDSNNISSIDGSSLAGGGGGGGGLEYGATAAYNNNKIGLGASGTGTTTDAGLYLSSTHGTGFYKVNEMTLNRSGYAETVKFNLGSGGAQVLLSASGKTRGAFHSAWNDSASASFGVSGKSAYLKLGDYTAYDTSIGLWNGTYGTVFNNSANWGGGGGGGIDSATCSAIASSYAESAVSSYALSADVSGTVDLVSSQSANWGGSALALSAGPGVKLEKVGNTLVASTDRELLWSGSATGNYTAQLSESKTNFEKIEIWHSWNPSVNCGPYVTTYGSDFERAGCMGGGCTTAANAPFSFLTVFSANNTAVTILTAGQGQGATPNDFNDVYKCLLRVYGINRTAEA